MPSRARGKIRNWMLACTWRWWKNDPSWGPMSCRLWSMKRDGFRARVPNLSDARFSGASTGLRSSARSQRKSRFSRRLDYHFPILIATSISTCSRPFFKSLGALLAGSGMFGFGILLDPGENHAIRQWDAGSSGLV